MTRPQSLWGIHVDEMPNFYMMIGPQSLNPVTNVTLLCEEQAKYIAELVSRMAADGQTEVEPTAEAVAAWTEKCNESSDGKVWLRCNNWYMKTTKTDAAANRERSVGMYMVSSANVPQPFSRATFPTAERVRGQGNYTEYLREFLGGAGGSQDELLAFS